MREDMSPAFLVSLLLLARARDSEQQKTVFYENEQLFAKMAGIIGNVADHWER